MAARGSHPSPCSVLRMLRTFYVATKNAATIILRCNEQIYERNTFASGKTTTSSRDNHVTKKYPVVLQQRISWRNMFPTERTTSSRDRLPWGGRNHDDVNRSFTEACFGSGPSRCDYGVDACGIVELGERRLFAWARRYIHHTTSGATVTCGEKT